MTLLSKVNFKKSSDLDVQKESWLMVENWLIWMNELINQITN